MQKTEREYSDHPWALKGAFQGRLSLSSLFQITLALENCFHKEGLLQAQAERALE